MVRVYLLKEGRSPSAKGNILVAKTLGMALNRGMMEIWKVPPLCFMTSWQELKEQKSIAFQPIRMLLHKLFLAATPSKDNPKVDVVGSLGMDWVLEVMGRLTPCYWSVTGLLDNKKLYKDVAGASLVCGFIGSIFNHACDPNVTFDCPLLPGMPGKLLFAARRAIRAGESLRVAYIEKDVPRDCRQQFLKAFYGFKCECRLCR